LNYGFLVSYLYTKNNLKIMVRKIQILCALGLITAAGNAQSNKEWHFRDFKKTKQYGVSLTEAYNMVKTKKSQTIVVAVIDSGIDTLHEDFTGKLWKNTKEIPYDGIDNDNNGYVDDVYGWNFLGGRDGGVVVKDSYERSRLYHTYREFGEKNADVEVGSDEWKKLSLAEQNLLTHWRKAEEEAGKNKLSDEDKMRNTMILTKLDEAITGLPTAMGKEKFTGKELKETKIEDAELKKTASMLVQIMEMNGQLDSDAIGFTKQIKSQVEGEMLKGSDAAPENYRGDITKDDELDWNDNNYGNPNVYGDKDHALHGTHVSGIIGANRNNKKGSNGIADNVKLMTLRVVPDGDEHDKDIAKAIRYAVDNGAKVINMSFGKASSPQKQWIDEAVQYAAKKGVLLVHAAGNSNEDIDIADNFPEKKFLNGTMASNWIEVGAIGPSNSTGLTANFSNFGKKEVDLFAPGVEIYATAPGSEYQYLQGTSMASPVVAGVAALVWSYYPKLTVAQIKDCLVKSVVKPVGTVNNPSTNVKVSMSTLCNTGGIVNAAAAMAYAAKLK
jgi:subtilisin family serine protease